MKRINRLFGPMICYSTAHDAFMKGIENKRTHPMVRELWTDEAQKIPLRTPLDNAVQFLDDEKVNRFLTDLLWDIQRGYYYHHPPRYKHLYCTSMTKGKNEGKWRDIYCPSLRDHTMHHILMEASMPAFTRGMIRWCVGSVPNRGTKDVIKQVSKWCREDKQFRYFVVIDIKQFFNSIRKEDVMAILQRKIKDKRILALHEQILDSGLKRTVKPFPPAVPVGYYPSPWYGNLLLEHLDHFILEGMYKVRRGKRVPFVKHYMRYADDMLLLGDNKRDLEKSIRLIQRFLEEHFGLTLKHSWEVKRIAEYTPEGKIKKGTYRINYVGYLFDRTRTIMRGGGYLSTRRLATRMAKHERRTGCIRRKDCMSLVSKVGFAAHIDNNAFMREINEIFPISKAKEVISNAAKCRVCFSPGAV